MIEYILNKKSKKITLLYLQRICGLLNFLCRSIVPGRAFTRRLYGKTATAGQLRPYHYIKVSAEMKMDLEVWAKFLRQPSVFSRPFVDFSAGVTATEIELFTDATKNPKLGFGGICGNRSWMAACWDEYFIIEKDPSIVYLELFAVMAAVLNWIKRLKNQIVILFCDNMSSVYMINSESG